MTANHTNSGDDFIREAVREDLEKGRFDYVHTRFPPEPNGYLHIGHTKAIHIDYGIAQEFAGKFNLRFDDTNPVKEEVEYVEAIKEDMRWFGADWEEREYYASDYFEQLYDYAVKLIEKGKAYVDDLSPDEIREYRGTLTEPGVDSPYRDRSVEENLDLFERMRAGEFPEARGCYAPKSICPRATSTCAIPLCTVLSTPSITVPEMNGAFTPCMTLPTDKATPSKGSPIPCAPLNMNRTDHCTSGSFASWKSFRPGKSSSPP